MPLRSNRHCRTLHRHTARVISIGNNVFDRVHFAPAYTTVLYCLFRNYPVRSEIRLRFKVVQVCKSVQV